ncbi:hypothetical protein GUITHDRAFT_119463 [Guillardia theta CCMP2712]|uniref:Uncharacterized protein n=1 Tax=Guillardia theta (strain CCMP2712) TaxID=905079 RepID=L1IEW0_GUITC|nr:hypothetical protein GUITHDRAFT_119463 [Guillardia theta CCMP2712]EKX34380.1 hypothetical protein GUITHDRAFT_119463 [Guillardia theta CCMP2712]|eukprot:XP_005821360.1 hypothetical protein GUITHDRAFT_119463 [Guillardia theta CCMP2712]
MSEVNVMQADAEITMNAIKKCFDELQINIPEALVEEKFKSLDVNKNGVLDYKEFMAIYREGNHLEHADKMLLELTVEKRLHHQAMEAIDDYLKHLKSGDDTRTWLEEQMSFHDLDLLDEGAHKLLWTESKLVQGQKLHAKVKEKIVSAWKGVKGQIFMLRYGHLMNKRKSDKSKNEPCMKGWLCITDEEDARPNHVQWTSRYFVLRKNQDLQWFVGEKEFLKSNRSIDFQLFHEFPQLKGKGNVFALRSLPPHAQTEWEEGDNRHKWIYFSAGTSRLREKWTSAITKVQKSGEGGVRAQLALMQGTVLDFLIAHGADVNVEDEFGCTALHLAADEGYAKGVQELLKIPTLKLDALSRRGLTAEESATQHGNQTIAQMIHHAAKMRR